MTDNEREAFPTYKPGSTAVKWNHPRAIAPIGDENPRRSVRGINRVDFDNALLCFLHGEVRRSDEKLYIS